MTICPHCGFVLPPLQPMTPPAAANPTIWPPYVPSNATAAPPLEAWEKRITLAPDYGVRW